MNREIITIENGIVSVPASAGIRMTIGEIAGLLGIYYRTAKRHVRAIEKLGVASGDYTLSCTVEGMNIYPDYYGLEMITALAFRIHSYKADLFRKWLMKQAINQLLNSFEYKSSLNIYDFNPN